MFVGRIRIFAELARVNAKKPPLPKSIEAVLDAATSEVMFLLKEPVITTLPVIVDVPVLVNEPIIVTSWFNVLTLDAVVAVIKLPFIF